MTIGTSSTLPDNTFNSASMSLRSLLPVKYSEIINENIKQHCLKIKTYRRIYEFICTITYYYNKYDKL